MLQLSMLLFKSHSSDDPVLDILQRDATAIFGRAYAGYILFLFGAADEEIATWFARRLVALDSLTSDDLACVLFADRVRVRSTRQPNSQGMRERERGGVPLEDIEHSPVVRLVKDGSSNWDPNESEITAITYAADEVARLLGVVDRLPCLVFLDAVYRKFFE